MMVSKVFQCVVYRRIDRKLAGNVLMQVNDTFGMGTTDFLGD